MKNCQVTQSGNNWKKPPPPKTNQPTKPQTKPNKTQKHKQKSTTTKKKPTQPKPHTTFCLLTVSLKMFLSLFWPYFHLNSSLTAICNKLPIIWKKVVSFLLSLMLGQILLSSYEYPDPLCSSSILLALLPAVSDILWHLVYPEHDE